MDPGSLHPSDVAQTTFSPQLESTFLPSVKKELKVKSDALEDATKQHKSSVVPRKGVEGLNPPLDVTESPSVTLSFSSPPSFDQNEGIAEKQSTLVTKASSSSGNFEFEAPVTVPMPTVPNISAAIKGGHSNSMESVTPLSANVSASVVRHHKPSSAVDVISNDSFNSTPIIIGSICGIVLVLSVFLLVYRKFKDVWSRRHYDRMDFLIEGMYDL